jgi:hypothetical protein
MAEQGFPRTAQRRLILYPDSVSWRGVERHFGPVRILERYLRCNPARKDDLLRALPKDAIGIMAYAVVRDGRLWLERVSVPGRGDVLLDMVLWHALFPGLKAPQVVYWMSGDHLLSTDPPDVITDRFWNGPERPEVERPDRPIRLVRGVLCTEKTGASKGEDLLDVDILRWPLVLRLLMVPLIIVLVPLAALWSGLKGRDKHAPSAWWIVLMTPVAIAAFTFRWIAPVTYERHFAARVDELGVGARRRRSVRELVDDALGGSRSRSKARR